MTTSINENINKVEPQTKESEGTKGVEGVERVERKNKKTKCSICNKNTGINYFTCKCDESLRLCDDHRFPFTHSCTVDSKSINKRKLEEENQKIEPSKVQKL